MVEPEPGADVPSRFRVDFVGRTLLGTYRVERRLAEGGMGSVYQALDTSLGMPVVVKVPHARFLGEPGFRTRFRREISELVRLEHPHVVRILARGEEDDVPYFVLQYLSGGSLEDRFRRGVQVPAEALGWLERVAATLDFVHDRGVVHRDVKPGNILFDEQGHVFLSDFGVVKALGRDDGAITEGGTGVGSPLYMAPEQALGHDVTGAADQYALASTLYEALAGTPPFGSATTSVVEATLRKQQEPPPSLRERAPTVPAACDAAILRALSRDPAERFPSCRAFAEEVRRSLAPPAAHVRPSGGRTVALAALAGVLLATVAAGAATDWFGLARPAQAPATDRLVVLVDPGAEPRSMRRFHPSAGATDRFVLHFDERSAQRVAGSTDVDVEPTNTHIVREQPIEVTVAAVESDGRVRLAWRFLPSRELASEGKTPEMERIERQFEEMFGTVDVRSVVAPDGTVLEAALDLPDERARKAAAKVGIEELARQLEVSLPTEPIGVGAVWDVTRRARQAGIRYQETVSFELLEATGDVLRLRFQGTQWAPDQKLAPPELPPELPPGFEANVDSIQVSSKGEVVVDLTRPAPLEFASTGTVSFGAKFVRGPERAALADVEAKVSYDVRLRRD